MDLPKIKAAFVGFGEVNTPREMIEKKCNAALAKLGQHGLELITTDPVTDDPEGKDVARACTELSNRDFDVLIICIAGWIPSYAVISLVDQFRHRPVLLWGLTGWQEGDRFVTTADQAGTTALRKTLEDLSIRFKYVFNFLGKEPDMSKIVSFTRAAQAAARLRTSRIGMMGYRDMNLYATLHDGVSLKARTGIEVEVFEMLEIAQLIEKLDSRRVLEVTEEMSNRWTFQKPPAAETLEKSAKLYLAVKQRVQERGYKAVSLIDVDGVKKLMGFPPAAVFMLLSEIDDVCVIPENDVMGSVTQLMLHYLTGQSAAYLEFYEFTETGFLIGVPDFVPSEVVDGRVEVLPTAFGKLGEGLLNVSQLKTGLVTLCRLFHTGDRYGLHLVTGTAKKPRKWEEAGWQAPAPQLPSLEVELDGSIEEFAGKVMGQHYILSYGDNTEAIGDLCRLLNIAVV